MADPRDSEPENDTDARITVSLPQELKDRLNDAADKDDRSMNNFCRKIIREAVEAAEREARAKLEAC
jgi:predicted HicB family RNase H-like nuclease